jgi:hypothetical protein
MSHSVQKQLLINQMGINLYLSDDLINIIKNYCFYDTKTYNTIKTIKLKKEEVNYIVKKVLLFYNFNYHDHLNYQHCGVVMHTLDDALPKIHIDNDICNTCGNYMNNLSLSQFPRKIICSCHH